MVVIFSVTFLFLFSISSALPDDSGNRIDFTYETPINYSLIPTVNNSLYWDGYTTATLPHNLLDNLEWSNAGHSIDGNIDMNDYTLTDMTSLILSGTGYLGDWDGVLNIVSHLAPTNDLSLALGLPTLRWNNLSVGSIYADGVDSYFNSTLLINGDIGTYNGDATLVINSGNNLYSCINLTEGSGHLGFQICSDGSGSNRLVFSNSYDGYEWMWIDRDDGSINFLNDTIIEGNLNVDGNFSAKRPYIMVSSNESQIVEVADTVYVMNFSHIEDEYLMDLEGGENITFQDDGDYVISLSGLFTTDTNNKHFNIFPQFHNSSGWFNFPRSNTRLKMENAGTDGMIAVTFILDIEQMDKIRLMYSSDDAGSMTKWTAGSGTGANEIPETPSMIMTIFKHSEITD